MVCGATNAQYINNQTTVQSPGNFNIAGQGKANSFVTIQATGSSGNAHYMMHQSDGNARWGIGMNTVESGNGNEGSNFSIFGYGGAGNYLGEYLSILRTTGFMGLGVRYPAAKLHVAGWAADNTSIRLGVPHDAGNTVVPLWGSPGGYNIDFYTWRDVAGDQIGSRIRAERINTHLPNNALVQAMDLAFSTSNGMQASELKEHMRIRFNGNVGIGTANPDEKLSVKGTIKAMRVKVLQEGWADFVFADSYKLPSLMEVERFITEHRHLPEIPSEKEVAENGVDLGEMNRRLLQKVEELTLYIIQQEKEMRVVKERLLSLERTNGRK
ncbi:hypothetical protein EGT74_27110 [Chitinophaga lutea]|uniref:Tail fiber domain-containing protein n=2 Tax=Chitinophaga lutea TaxID=2488634 RepID=A0A3N4PM95_9BACT|nr:hypothetical protein EGT74_27110 [Chitinophaga lutea]